LVELERLDDGFNLLHLSASRAFSDEKLGRQVTRDTQGVRSSHRTSLTVPRRLEAVPWTGQCVESKRLLKSRLYANSLRAGFRASYQPFNCHFVWGSETACRIAGPAE